MTKFMTTGRVLPHELLDRFKWEVAAQKGLSEQACDRIGGRLVKVRIRHAEQAPEDDGAGQ